LLVRATLESPERRIIEAVDGANALQVAQLEKPDLIIIDWMMPGLTGIQVIAKLREDKEVGKIPVIMLTARAREHDRREGVLLGIRAYLVKPFSPRELMDRVEKALSS
jgi:DNA-binding response OmpR family regulator